MLRTLDKNTRQQTKRRRLAVGDLFDAPDSRRKTHAKG